MFSGKELLEMVGERRAWRVLFVVRFVAMGIKPCELGRNVRRTEPAQTQVDRVTNGTARRPAFMREEIRKEVESIMAFDSLERDTLREVLDWIDSGAELCRVAKPAIPAKHLVSYFAVVDGDHLLLVDHIKAERWLPTGGHVEPNEHPRDTVLREVREELGIAGSFLLDRPVLITSTETVGKTAGHTDISIWYALKGDRSGRIRIDKTEFHEARWFRNDDLPANSDPHLPRFVEKLYAEILLGSQQDD